MPTRTGLEALECLRKIIQFLRKSNLILVETTSVTHATLTEQILSKGIFVEISDDINERLQYLE